MENDRRMRHYEKMGHLLFLFQEYGSHERSQPITGQPQLTCFALIASFSSHHPLAPVQKDYILIVPHLFQNCDHLLYLEYLNAKSLHKIEKGS